MIKFRFENFEDSVEHNIRVHQELERYIKSGFCRVPVAPERNSAGFLLTGQPASRKPTDDERQALLRELSPDDAPFLAANNLTARTNFMKIWNDQCAGYGSGRRTYLVTFTPLMWAMNLAHAKQFKLTKIKAFVREILRGFDFIANIEIAPYTNWQHQLQRGNIYHLHVHAIVFSGDELELDRRIGGVKRKHPSLLPGVSSAHWEQIKYGTLEHVLLYAVKAPTFKYRAAQIRNTAMDLRTGFEIKVSTGRFFNNLDPANPGLQLQVREIMADWHLDKMIFAGGEAKGLLSSICNEALDLPRRMRSKRQHAFSGAFKSDVFDAD